jgi:hypothetical protein
MAETTTNRYKAPIRALALAGLLACGLPIAPTALAQAPAASANTSSIGTVKTISGSAVTLTTDAGKTITITVADTARILQLAPGSKDLKSAQVITLADIAAGDRVLVTGKPGDSADSLTASRVILMKSTAIAEQHASEQDAWRKQGMSGIVTSVTPSASGLTLIVSAGARKLTVQTDSSTIFRRYAGDSVKFQDAKPGNPSEIHAGDQISVRGPKSEDGATLTAQEAVSGSFRNLSGLVSAVDPANGTITLKDLATKQTVKVVLTANSDLRNLPPEAAARFAARAKGTPAGAAGAPPAGGPPAGGAFLASGAPPAGGARSAGMDLSQLLSRLPSETLADLKPGAAVMIVASKGDTGGLTAVTLLSGVEPILSATPSGEAPMTLSPWNMGAAGGPEGGGGGR